MPEITECCHIMIEMTENEIFKINEIDGEIVLTMNTYKKQKSGINTNWYLYDYQVDYCPNCGKKVEII